MVSKKQSNMRKVAIIIPTVNNLKHLEVTVNSLLKNTNYPEWRLILVNPPSIDGTTEYCNYLVKKYKNITTYHPNTKTSIEACNFGIKQTMPNEDIFLTQDDVIIPKLYSRNWLYEMVRTSEEENVGIVTTLNGGGISGAGYLSGLRWVGTWSMYLCRRTINKVGLFDEDMKIGEDIDYTYRVYQAGLNVITLNLWFEHHQTRISPHQDQSQDIIRQAEEYFKKKHNLT